MKLILQGKELVPRIQSFNEINLDFYFFNDNVFHFDRKNLLPMFKMIADIEDGGNNADTDQLLMDNDVLRTLVTEMANKLFTVCTVYCENPYI